MAFGEMSFFFMRLNPSFTGIWLRGGLILSLLVYVIVS